MTYSIVKLCLNYLAFVLRNRNLCNSSFFTFLGKSESAPNLQKILWKDPYQQKQDSTCFMTETKFSNLVFNSLETMVLKYVLKNCAPMSKKIWISIFNKSPTIWWMCLCSVQSEPVCPEIKKCHPERDNKLNRSFRVGFVCYEKVVRPSVVVKVASNLTTSNYPNLSNSWASI